MDRRRASMNKRLWSLVRLHPGGEEAMRDAVAVIRQEDGTGRELAGTSDYTSTRLLNDAQLQRLIDRVAAHVAPAQRRRNEAGVAVFLAASKQRRYIERLASELGWSPEALETFVLHQTQGHGVRTTEDANAVIAPLERQLRERGYQFETVGRRKWFTPPASSSE